MRTSVVAAMTRKPWTQKDTDFLLKNYPAMGCKRCAEKLGRTTKAIALKLDKLAGNTPRKMPAARAADEYGEHSVGYQRKPSTITTRRCTDCKRPTTDFRCPACWEKRRAKYRDSCDGPTADELYGVMA